MEEDDDLRCSGEECWYARKGRPCKDFCTVYERDADGDSRIVLCDVCINDPEYDEFTGGRKCRKCKTMCLYDPGIHGDLCSQCYFGFCEEHDDIFASHFISNAKARVSEFNALCASIDTAFHLDVYNESIGEHILAAINGADFKVRMEEMDFDCIGEFRKFPALFDKWKAFFYSIVQTSIDQILVKEPEIRKMRRETATQSAISALAKPQSKGIDDVIRAIVAKMDDYAVSQLASSEDPIGCILKFLSQI
jgi:hypothetical protein